MKTIEIHNLLEDSNDLPPIAPFNRYNESAEVLVLYRTIEYNEVSREYELEISSMSRAFYSYDDGRWYSFYDEPMSRLYDCFDPNGGQEVESRDILLRECEYSEDLVNQLTSVPGEEGYVYVKEIIGWFEIPSYREWLR